MSIQAVIFDFGGVFLRLQDPTGRHKWELRLGLEEGALGGIVFGSEVAARATTGELPEAAVWEHIATVFSLGDAQMEEFLADFWAGDGLEDELVAFLRTLRPRYKTAILSNAWDGAREVISYKYGLRDLVDLIVISAEEGIAKPDPAIYQLALDRLDVRPEETIFVDDRADNIEAARALGMVAIQCLSTAQAIADIQSHLT